MLTCTCPVCSHSGKAPDTMAGKRIRCPKCRELFNAPAIAGPSVAEALSKWAPSTEATSPFTNLDTSGNVTTPRRSVKEGMQFGTKLAIGSVAVIVLAGAVCAAVAWDRGRRAENNPEAKQQEKVVAESKASPAKQVEKKPGPPKADPIPVAKEPPVPDAHKAEPVAKEKPKDPALAIKNLMELIEQGKNFFKMNQLENASSSWEKVLSQASVESKEEQLIRGDARFWLNFLVELRIPRDPFQNSGAVSEEKFAELEKESNARNQRIGRVQDAWIEAGLSRGKAGERLRALQLESRQLMSARFNRN